MTAKIFLFCACLISLYVLSTTDGDAETRNDKVRKCRALRTCGECISEDPGCVWCAGENNSTNQVFRCSYYDEAQCPSEFLENPQSNFYESRNDDFTNVKTDSQAAIQLKPQKINLELRKDQEIAINITFRKTVEYPLDLYYVMDLSNSMKDDLDTLKGLGENLINDIKSNVTNNVKLGFGSFVDKVMMPYASTVEDHLKNPCDQGDCGPVFGFNHQLPITENPVLFQTVVKSTNISGNIDSPEGGFDALMQIAVCEKKVGWRKDALRVILYASDASPHIALDGKLAAILEANDKGCHLQKNANPYLKGETVYSKSKELDYPSVGQLLDVFKKHKITTIFAVTKDVYELYEDLEKVLKPYAFAGELKEDSSNVVDVISESYNELKSLIELTPPTVPSNVEMAYEVLCPNSTEFRQNTLKCENAGNLGDEVVFRFKFKALACPDDVEQTDTITITSGQLSDETTINIKYLCKCGCSETLATNSTNCNNKGNFECGACNCYSGYTGKSCQCTAENGDAPLEEMCKNTKTQSLCSGNGFCECGQCKCFDGYSGDHCECIPTGCPANKDGFCGGPEKGVCRNCNGDKQCECRNGYTKSDKTGVCSCNPKLCKKNPDDEAVCSGNGDCDCDKCTCQLFDGKTPEYEGKFCEECIHPNCKERPGTCENEEFYLCAECVYNSVRQSKNAGEECEEQCSSKQISYYTFDKLPDCSNTCSNGTYTDDCKTCEKLHVLYSSKVCVKPVTEVSCEVTYRVFWDTEQKEFSLYVQKFNQETDCAKPIDPLLIVFPVVGAIFLIGFVLLIVWKAYTHFRDKVEYRTFLEDQKKSRWTQGENPLFSKASVRVENPAFIGK